MITKLPVNKVSIYFYLVSPQLYVYPFRLVSDGLRLIKYFGMYDKIGRRGGSRCKLGVVQDR